MTHLRGHPKDYESWAESTGDPSWSYSGVLPYFKRYETFSGTSNDRKFTIFLQSFSHYHIPNLLNCI